MKAIGLSKYGGPDVLHPVELPDPHATTGEVRVHVRAAALNPVDVLLRNGTLAGWYAGQEPPFVPGMDISGTIDEIGPEVEPAFGLEIGQAVVGVIDSTGSHGGYSEYVTLPAESVTATPKNTDWAHAASFLMNALAARNALDLSESPAGGAVLITGAAGALGAYAVALAHADGYRVIALASAADEQRLRALGADEFVARGEDAADRVRRLVPEGVDAVIDAALLFDQIAPALRNNGKFVDLRARDGELGRGIEIVHSNVRKRVADQAAIRRLREQVESGVLWTSVAQTFPASEATEAHRRLDEGGLRGRIILLFDECHSELSDQS
ncbi:NADP-dependent oxidoreductase [Rhodococcus opacus]|uniref:NADP-dependent oxidoreductase n=1 Tax=Rhodococcus opacus TaxID=37919 RepID=UPI001C444B5C|nr:NADP-dependent oxidoreductase [Rhodococcus opacus]MBV6756726.1 NADP-dependent oxidoreductase [Rhodococcus opacus]